MLTIAYIRPILQLLHTFGVLMFLCSYSMFMEYFVFKFYLLFNF